MRDRSDSTAVVLETTEGPLELVFATYWQAEYFVYLLPMLMAVGQWNTVTSAIISPLVEPEKNNGTICAAYTG